MATQGQLMAWRQDRFSLGIADPEVWTQLEIASKRTAVADCQNGMLGTGGSLQKRAGFKPISDFDVDVGVSFTTPRKGAFDRNAIRAAPIAIPWRVSISGTEILLVLSPQFATTEDALEKSPVLFSVYQIQFGSPARRSRIQLDEESLGAVLPDEKHVVLPGYEWGQMIKVPPQITESDPQEQLGLQWTQSQDRMTFTVKGHPVYYLDFLEDPDPEDADAPLKWRIIQATFGARQAPPLNVKWNPNDTETRPRGSGFDVDVRPDDAKVQYRVTAWSPSRGESIAGSVTEDQRNLVLLPELEDDLKNLAVGGFDRIRDTPGLHVRISEDDAVKLEEKLKEDAAKTHGLWCTFHGDAVGSYNLIDRYFWVARVVKYDKPEVEDGASQYPAITGPYVTTGTRPFDYQGPWAVIYPDPGQDAISGIKQVKDGGVKTVGTAKHQLYKPEEGMLLSFLKFPIMNPDAGLKELWVDRSASPDPSKWVIRFTIAAGDGLGLANSEGYYPIVRIVGFEPESPWNNLNGLPLLVKDGDSVTPTPPLWFASWDGAFLDEDVLDKRNQFAFSSVYTEDPTEDTVFSKFENIPANGTGTLLVSPTVFSTQPNDDPNNIPAPLTLTADDLKVDIVAHAIEQDGAAAFYTFTPIEEPVLKGTGNGAYWQVVVSYTRTGGIEKNYSGTVAFRDSAPNPHPRSYIVENLYADALPSKSYVDPYPRFPKVRIGQNFITIPRGDPRGVLSLSWDPATIPDDSLDTDIVYLVYQRDGALFNFIGSTRDTQMSVDGLTADRELHPQRHPELFGPLLRKSTLKGGDDPTDAVFGEKDKDRDHLRGKFYPQSSAHHEGRKIYSGLEAAPTRIHASRSLVFDDFSYSRPRAGDDAIEIEIDSGVEQTIRHLISARSLLVLTDKQEFRITTPDQQPLTPYNIVSRPQGAYGSGVVQPVPVFDGYAVVDKTHRRVLRYRYSFESDAFEVTDLTANSRGIFAKPRHRITSLAFLDGDYPMLAATLENGKMAVLCFQARTPDVGWFLWTTGKLVGLTEEPTDHFRRVFTLSQLEPALYAIVERLPIDPGTGTVPPGTAPKFSLERYDLESIRAATFLDRALGDEPAASGDQVWTDGSQKRNFRFEVRSISILDKDHTRMRRKINQCWIQTLSRGPFQAAADPERYYEMNIAIRVSHSPHYTRQLTLNGPLSHEPTIYIKQDKPEPFHLISIDLELTADAV